METVTASTEINTEKTEDEEIWKSHLQSALNFIGTEAEYCRRNRISLTTFRSYKEKFGMTKHYKRRPNAFARVERAEQLKNEKTNVTHCNGRNLPDAKWMAEFVLALMERR